MFKIDRLRTAYVHLPTPLRRAISPLLALLPVDVRFGRTYRAYRQYIERARSDTVFVAEWQRDRLRAILDVACTEAPHYRRLAQKIVPSAGGIAAFEVHDLASWPVLTKDDLRADLSAFLCRPPETLDLVSTSGTSGTPMSFYLDKDRSPKEWAFVQDCLAQIDYSPRKVRAVLRGILMPDVDRKPWEFEAGLSELRLSPFHLTDRWMNEYCALILKFGATFLHGYPSAISIFASYIQRTGRDDVAGRIEGVLGISEAFFPHQRRAIGAAFPKARITSFYGLTEKVLFGRESAIGPDTYELDPLYGIAELVRDDGQPVVEPGQVGRIIGTGLLYSGMPLIRYDTGDRATLVENASPANGFRMTVRNIASRRSQEFLVGSGGELISMTAINVHSPAYLKMSAFQFHQTEPGSATLRAVMAPGFEVGDLGPFIDEVSAKVGGSLALSITQVTEVKRGGRGKFRFIDQEIDLSKYDRSGI